MLLNEPAIKTERLILRKVDPEIYQHLFETRSVDEIKSYFGFKTDEEFLNEKNRYEQGLTSFNKSFLNFLMLEKKSEKVIGSCGFHTWYLNHNRAEIGYSIYEEPYKRKGFMKEALIPVIAFGFQELELNRIEAFIGPNNPASLKLVRSLGFQQEGHLREHYVKDDQAEDSLVFSLLKREYLHG